MKSLKITKKLFFISSCFVLLSIGNYYSQRTFKCAYCGSYDESRFIVKKVNYEFICSDLRGVILADANNITWCSCKCAQSDQRNAKFFSFNNKSYNERKRITDEEERIKIEAQKKNEEERARVQKERAQMAAIKKAEDEERNREIENERREREKKQAIKLQQEKLIEDKRKQEQLKEDELRAKASYEAYLAEKAEEEKANQAILDNLKKSSKIYIPSELTEAVLGSKSMINSGIEGVFMPEYSVKGQTSIKLIGKVVLSDGNYYLEDQNNSKSLFGKIKFSSHSNIAECSGSNIKNFKKKEITLCCFVDYQNSNLEISSWELESLNTMYKCLEELWEFDNDKFNNELNDENLNLMPQTREEKIRELMRN
jgi:hypothetical protein